MSQICEISRKKIPHLSNLPEGKKIDPKVHRRLLLKRKIKVPEIKGTVSLKVTAEGLKEVNAAGGLAKYLKDADDKKLTPRLLRLKRKIHGEPKPEKPAEAAKAEAAPAPAAAPAEKPAEAKAEEKKDAAPAEKPVEAAKAEAAPAGEKKEETPAVKSAEEKKE